MIESTRNNTDHRPTPETTSLSQPHPASRLFQQSSLPRWTLVLLIGFWKSRHSDLLRISSFGFRISASAGSGLEFRVSRRSGLIASSQRAELGSRSISLPPRSIRVEKNISFPRGMWPVHDVRYRTQIKAIRKHNEAKRTQNEAQRMPFPCVNESILRSNTWVPFLQFARNESGSGRLRTATTQMGYFRSRFHGGTMGAVEEASMGGCER
jgi:hypothetical protein